VERATRSAQFEVTFDQLAAAAARPSPRQAPGLPRWAVWTWAPLAASLAVVALWVRPAPPQVRAKGQATLAVVNTQGQEIRAAAVGDEVALAVTSPTDGYALVLARDPSGQVQRLWPVDGARSGPVPRATRAVLAPAFRVTQGSLALVAILSDRPVDAAQAIRALEAGGSAAALPGEHLRTWTQLDVHPDGR
jgi:hypothetical protein